MIDEDSVVGAVGRGITEAAGDHLYTAHAANQIAQNLLRWTFNRAVESYPQPIPMPPQLRAWWEEVYKFFLEAAGGEK